MQNIFTKMTPSLKYIAIRWPYSKHILKKYVMSNYSKPDLFKLCTSCLKDLNFRINHPLLRSLKDLSLMCNSNPTCNFYHDSHHFKSVVIISSIFAKILNLRGFDVLILIIIALTHDLNHRGRRNLKKPCHQELASIRSLNYKIFKYFLNHNKWKRIERIILNTYFLKSRVISSDIVEKIILDVDILVSMMFGQEWGILLSRRLKHEQKLEVNSKVLFKEFLNLAKERGLYLDVSKVTCTI